jgi:catechol 2,3-dioxygenase-like lactoylglutathione lyase family enzyme
VIRLRRSAVVAVVALALALLATAALAAPPRVAALALTVADADRAAAFYTNVLKFERVSDVEVAGAEFERLQGVFGARARIVTLRLGNERLELTQFLAPAGRSFPEDSRANDHWFQHVAIVVPDMARAYAELRRAGVRHASTGPQRLPDWNTAAAGIEAFYFRDPDGHFLELIRFPPGKGDPRWQQDGGRLFLGIDHTAIVVADTERSLRFWRDAVGLEVKGGSENFGPEQERLNNVFGARLRITTLRGAAGPGVELLEYLAPRDGRPRPAGARANDLATWQTRLVVPDASRAADLLRAPPGGWVSPGVIELPGAELGYARAAQVADPDGHAVLLTEGDR